MSLNEPLIIYDHRIRWVAAVNMAFVVVGIWFAVRVGSGFPVYLAVGFLGLFSLFWIRSLLFGFRLKLLSDGHTLHWQEGKVTGSLPLAQIRKVLIGVRTTQIGDGVFGWTYVRFRLNSGAELALPPNLASGLRSRKWRHLKRLVAHLRTVSNLVVEPISGPDLTIEGWKDEPTSPATTESLPR